MKKIHNYIMLLVVAFAFASCADDEIINKREPAQTGDEVQFGLSLESLSRTVYGDENKTADADGVVTARSYPIYWLDGDKVRIFSPQCLTDRRFAEYKVVLPDNGDKAYYAKDLVKTGAYGVQWGAAATADFYSLYPSGNYTLGVTKEQENVAEGISIGYNQNIKVNGTSVKSDMEDCLLYAKATGVSKGDVVNLHYDPIATVFMLTLSVDKNSTKDFVIQSVSITTPAEETYIAGSFSLKIADGSFAEWGDNKDNIVSAAISDVATGGYFTLGKDNSIEIPLFLAPVTGLNTNGWKISVKTIVDGTPQTFIKTLDARTVEAGKIHKVVLPKLTIKAEEVKEWDPATWMVNIPRNVYLSEVSIPGSWNSLNQDSQGTTENYTNISTQYSKGIRAFHIDTRWKRTGSRNNYTYELGVAIGGSGNTTSGDNKYMTAGATFKEALEEIILNLKNDEYMVVICTFAQNSAEYNGSDGWVQAISDICAEKTEVYDAKKLAPSTVVGDVLNKVIVLINMQGAFTAVPSNSKCLFINYPMEVTRDMFPATLTDVLTGPIYSSVSGSTSIKDSGISMYRSHSQICFNEETYSYTDPADSERDNVDNRGFLPTLGERNTVVNNILNWSKDNYGKENYAHDKWIYLGLGGYHFYRAKKGLFLTYYEFENDDSSYDDVAEYYNTWIDGKVKEMGTTPTGQTNPIPYYPVGIVLMNYVNNYSSTAKNILLLNNKYQLQYDPNKSPDYNPNLLPASEYNAVMLNGGAVFQ